MVLGGGEIPVQLNLESYRALHLASHSTPLWSTCQELLLHEESDKTLHPNFIQEQTVITLNPPLHPNFPTHPNRLPAIHIGTKYPMNTTPYGQSILCIDAGLL